jgi:secondary thiamine-phosphate synthase enzyme
LKIISRHHEYSTKGAGDLINITADLVKTLEGSSLTTGNMIIFVQGSTAGMTTFEYEPGLIADIREFYQDLIPSGRDYHHDRTWGDANGFSHLRATLTGQSLTVPFESGRLLLGTWQQVVLAEFDNRPRKRLVVCQLIGQ